MDDDIWHLFCIFFIVGFLGLLGKSNYFLLSVLRNITRLLFKVWDLGEDGIRILLKKPKRIRKPRRGKYF